MDELIRKTRTDCVDELKARMRAGTAMIVWMKQVLLTYDGEQDLPKDMDWYRSVTGAAVGYFRELTMFSPRQGETSWMNQLTPEISCQVIDVLRQLWYETMVSEVRCLQNHGDMSIRRGNLQKALAQAVDLMECDVKRLQSKIGCGPEWDKFENQLLQEASTVTDRVRQLIPLAQRHGDVQSHRYLHVINGGTFAAGDDQTVGALCQQG